MMAIPFMTIVLSIIFIMIIFLMVVITRENKTYRSVYFLYTPLVLLMGYFL